MYGGEKAIPTMLSCLDFNVAWSGRNWWILETGVKPCPNAPRCDYAHDSNSDGTPEQWQKNLRLLQELKPLAGPIPAIPIRSKYPPIPYLNTDPPIDFTPTFKDTEQGGVEIKSGFLDVMMSRGGGSSPYSVSDSYSPIYRAAARLRRLPSSNPNPTAKLNITPQQMKELTDLLNKFAAKLCGSDVSDLRISNFYNLLVNDSDYCPDDIDRWAMLSAYKEAPAGPIKEQAKADLMDSVHIFSQNYHAGTVEFVEAAKKIFTPAQLEEILR